MYKVLISGIGQRNHIQEIIKYMEKNEIPVFFMDSKIPLFDRLLIDNLSDDLQIKRTTEGEKDNEL